MASQQPGLLLGQPAPRLDEVGPAGQRAVQRLGPAPPGDARRGRPSAAPRAPSSPGTRPGGCTAAPRAVRPAGRRTPVSAEDSLPITPGSRRVTVSITTHGRHLPAGQHVVADRQLAVDQVLADAVVDALVAPAQQAEALARGQLLWPRPGRSGGHRARGGAGAGAARRPRRWRTPARGAAPCRPRRRRGRRRRCGGRRWCARAGRGSAGPRGRWPGPGREGSHCRRPPPAPGRW